MGWLAFFACLLGISVLTQITRGAYVSELGGYPDEPGHHVTALMFDQYVRDGFVERADRYAEWFYVRYPKVAIGHWPPVFYVVQALWTLLLSPSREAYLSLQAILASLFALLVFLYARKQTGAGPAALVAVLTLLTPVMQVQVTQVMADALVACLMFSAAFWASRFFDTGRTADATVFGTLTAAAILTKGTGLLLLGLPVLLVICRRDWAMLRRRAFYGAVLAPLLICLPWQILTSRYAWNGMQHDSFALSYSTGAILPGASAIFLQAGLVFSALAVLGAVLCLSRSSLYQAMLGLFLLTYAFNVIVPSGIELRKMIPALGPIAFLAACGLQSTIRVLSMTKMQSASACALAAGLFLAVDAKGVTKQSLGFTEAAQYIERTSSPGTAILVSSDSDGEGMVISEYAFLRPKPDRFLVRASKYLARSYWNGVAYVPHVSSTDDVIAAIRKAPISYVVVDTRESGKSAHHRLVRQAMRDPMFARVFTSRSGSVEIYRTADKDKRLTALRLDLTPMLGRHVTFSRSDP